VNRKISCFFKEMPKKNGSETAAERKARLAAEAGAEEMSKVPVKPPMSNEEKARKEAAKQEAIAKARAAKAAGQPAGAPAVSAALERNATAAAEEARNVAARAAAAAAAPPQSQANAQNTEMSVKPETESARLRREAREADAMARQADEDKRRKNMALAKHVANTKRRKLLRGVKLHPEKYQKKSMRKYPFPSKTRNVPRYVKKRSTKGSVKLTHNKSWLNKMFTQRAKNRQSANRKDPNMREIRALVSRKWGIDMKYSELSEKRKGLVSGLGTKEGLHAAKLKIFKTSMKDRNPESLTKLNAKTFDNISNGKFTYREVEKEVGALDALKKEIEQIKEKIETTDDEISKVMEDYKEYSKDYAEIKLKHKGTKYFERFE
jgi:hypothetical protein